MTNVTILTFLQKHSITNDGEQMRKVPYGRVTTIVEICKWIARKHQVQGCCSLVTGIVISTAANAAEEALQQGKDLGIPYWRTLKADGFLNDKFPGGIDAQKALLEREGLRVVSRGKRMYVENFDQALVIDFYQSRSLFEST